MFGKPPAALERDESSDAWLELMQQERGSSTRVSQILNQPAASRLVGEGKDFGEYLADVVHGEGSMGLVNRHDRLAWRREAFALMSEFRAEFDPQKIAVAMLKKQGGMSFEDACKRMERDPDWDPLMLVNNGPGFAKVWGATKEAQSGDSAALEEWLRAIGQAGSGPTEDS
jgi:hypothetical protein